MVLRLYGYGAWIESGNEILEEHAVEVKENVISCYVCSEEGKVRVVLPHGLLCIPKSSLTRYFRKEFTLYFDDDGSHSCEQVTTYGLYGRSVGIKMDGQQVEYLWSGVKQKVKSEGMPSGDIVQPYIFAPIDTTGSSVALSMSRPI